MTGRGAPTRVLVAGDSNGRCQCGCGETTPLAPRTDTSKGWTAGEPLKFVRGHRRPHPVAAPYQVDLPDGPAFAVPLGGLKAAGRVALVDIDDLPVVAAVPWSVYERERPGRRPDGPYAVSGRLGRMHLALTGWPQADHINGDGLDNRRANLRPATTQQNNQNQRSTLRSSSQYRGVFWYSPRNCWAAQINVDGCSTHLGYFAVEEDAARAYDAAAIETWGEYANPNFGGWR